jgi:hypothetical protein
VRLGTREPPQREGVANTKLCARNSRATVRHKKLRSILAIRRDQGGPCEARRLEFGAATLIHVKLQPGKLHSRNMKIG